MPKEFSTDSEVFVALGDYADFFRGNVANMRVDLSLGSKIARADVDFPPEDFFDDYVVGFIDLHTHILDRFRLVEAVDAYKEQVRKSSIPEDPNVMFSVLAGMPDWRRRKYGVRTEIIRDIAEMWEEESFELSIAKWTYLLMEWIDFLEKYWGGVSFSNEKQFSRFINKYPIKGWQPSGASELLSYYFLVLMFSIDQDKTKGFVESTVESQAEIKAGVNEILGEIH